MLFVQPLLVLPEPLRRRLKTVRASEMAPGCWSSAVGAPMVAWTSGLPWRAKEELQLVRSWVKKSGLANYM